MTDKEIGMARQCGHNAEVEFPDNKAAFNISYESFLAGLKAGKPQWHDLKKNPNDLPKESDEYLVWKINGYGCKSRALIQYNSRRRFWCVDCQNDVIAWCDIPPEEE